MPRRLRQAALRHPRGHRGAGARDALAIFVTEGLDENTGETIVALVFMIVAAPFLSHATIRAIRVRDRGDWRQPRTSRRPPADAKAKDAAR